MAYMFDYWVWWDLGFQLEPIYWTDSLARCIIWSCKALEYDSRNINVDFILHCYPMTLDSS